MLDAFRELIDELIDAPKSLRDAGITGTDDAQALDLLAAIADRDAALQERITLVIRQDSPLLKAPPETGSTTEGAPEVVARFDSGRGELVSTLMNLTLKDWERTGIDWTGHERSVADDVEEHVEYDEVTVARILALLEQS